MENNESKPLTEFPISMPPAAVPTENEKRTKVYISGPMTGIEEFNHAPFNSAAEKLRAEGHEVYNPAERPFDNLRDAFAVYCGFICEADRLYMLRGWEESVGARAERALGIAVGCEIVYEV